MVAGLVPKGGCSTHICQHLELPARHIASDASRVISIVHPAAARDAGCSSIGCRASEFASAGVEVPISWLLEAFPQAAQLGTKPLAAELAIEPRDRIGGWVAPQLC